MDKEYKISWQCKKCKRYHHRVMNTPSNPLRAKRLARRLDLFGTGYVVEKFVNESWINARLIEAPRD